MKKIILVLLFILIGIFGTVIMQKNLLVGDKLVSSADNCQGGECIYFWLMGKKMLGAPEELVNIEQNVLPLTQRLVALYALSKRFSSPSVKFWEMMHLDSMQNEISLQQLLLKYGVKIPQNEFLNKIPLPLDEADLCLTAHDLEQKLAQTLESISPSRSDSKELLQHLLVQSKYQHGSFLEHCKREFESRPR